MRVVVESRPIGRNNGFVAAIPLVEFVYAGIDIKYHVRHIVKSGMQSSSEDLEYRVTILCEAGDPADVRTCRTFMMRIHLPKYTDHGGA